MTKPEKPVGKNLTRESDIYDRGSNDMWEEWNLYHKEEMYFHELKVRLQEEKGHRRNMLFIIKDERKRMKERIYFLEDKIKKHLTKEDAR